MVSDLYIKREVSDFTQHFAAERPTPVNLLRLLHEGDDMHTRVSVDYAGGAQEGTVIVQAAKGVVQVHFDRESA